MSLVLQPQANFTVVRQIANHLDSATYYVRAVIRNAYTDEILKTLNLTDKGSQRFKGDWLVPADPSGQGFYISIVTSVYTDNGYTTKSENYGDEENTYLVQNRVLFGGTGGGGAGVDYTRIKDILSKEVSKIPEMIDVPDYSTYLEALRNKINAVSKDVAKIPTERVDLGEVLGGIAQILVAINDKAVTPPTDIQPIINAIASLEQTTGVTARELANIILTLEDSMVGSITESITAKSTQSLKENIRSMVPELGKSVVKALAERMSGSEKPTVPEEPIESPIPFDLTKLGT